MTGVQTCALPICFPVTIATYTGNQNRIIQAENTYGDALEYEFKINNIPYEREKKYTIEYKDILLPRYYFSDFTVYDEIILELKAIESLSSSEIKQTLNYLAASKNKIGLLINFGEDSLKYKRIIL